jgi:hypothetical protein
MLSPLNTALLFPISPDREFERNPAAELQRQFYIPAVKIFCGKSSLGEIPIRIAPQIVSI